MTLTLRIHLLGDFRLNCKDEPVTTVNTSRLQSLLAYLVLRRNAPQPRHHLAFLLWPDSTEAQARTNLRKQIYFLRRALPNANRFLFADVKVLQWQPDAPFALDVVDFEDAVTQADQAQSTGDQAALRASLEQAIALYEGDLLPSCYDDWILAERERLRQRFAETLERLILLLESQRDYQAAIKYAQHLLRHDPLHEATYRRLMRLHALSGNRTGALRTYHTCTTVLQRELAVEPSTATHEAYERLLKLDAVPAPPTEPLVAVVPLVGRDREWTQLQTAMSSIPEVIKTNEGANMKRRELVFLIGITVAALFVAFAWDSDEILITLAQSPLPTSTFTPTPVPPAPTPTDTPVPPTTTSVPPIPTPTDTPIPSTPTPTSIDTKPPVSRVRRLKHVHFTPSFEVQWKGHDRGESGLKCYDVEYKDGSGSWQDWKTCTTATSARFHGKRGHLYFFRARATDNAGNVEAWPSKPDTWTYVRR